MAILIDVHNFFMTHDVVHLFICLFVIFLSSLARCLLRSFVHFLMGWLGFIFVCFVFVFLLLKFKSSLCILDNSLFSDISFANVFSHSVVCLFTLLTVSFTEKKFLILIKSRFSILSFKDLALILYLKSNVHTQGHLDFVLC